MAHNIILFLLAYLHRRRRRRCSIGSQKQAKKHPPIPIEYSKRDDLECIELENNDSYNMIRFRNSPMPRFIEPQITKYPSDAAVIEEEGVYSRIDGEPVRADYAHEIGSDRSLTIPSTELKHSRVHDTEAANKADGGTSADVGGGEVVYSNPIPIPWFGKHVAELHTNSNQPFKDLYQVVFHDIKQTSYKASIG